MNRIYDTGAGERFRSKTKEESPPIHLNVVPSMGDIDYFDLTLHDIPYRPPPLIQQTENLLGQSAFGVDVNQRGAFSRPYERSRKDTSVHHSIHTPLKTELVDLVNEDSFFMPNTEYKLDRMDLDTRGVPGPPDLQPTPTLTSDDPYLYPPGPAPDEGIGETSTTYLSPPRQASRPRSRLDRLIGIENGLEDEESEETSSEDSTSSTEGHSIPVHPISGGGEWTTPSDIFPLQFPDMSLSTDLPTLATRRTPSASQPKRRVHRENVISGHASVVRGRKFGTAPKERARKEPLPCSSQQPNPEKPQTDPMLPAQYHLIETIPVVLPRVPCAITRARRLLLPSRESQPIAWVSMRGDTQWVDPKGR